jgi:hypothetical protein
LGFRWKDTVTFNSFPRWIVLFNRWRKQYVKLKELLRNETSKLGLLSRKMSLCTYRQVAAVPLRQQVTESGCTSSSGQKLALTDTEWDSEPLIYGTWLITRE